MQWVRNVLKKILPDRFIEWYRRKRAVRQYLGSLSYEIYDRTIRFEVEDLEGRIAARRHGFYQSLVKDVLERTELVLQELDRKIEGVNARHGNELRSLREEIESLRASVEALRREAAVAAPSEAGVLAEPERAGLAEPERAGLAEPERAGLAEPEADVLATPDEGMPSKPEPGVSAGVRPASDR